VLIIAVLTAAMVAMTMTTLIINENNKGGKESTVVAAIYQAVSRNCFKRKSLSEEMNSKC
jgi:hypothetical protein